MSGALDDSSISLAPRPQFPAARSPPANAPLEAKLRSFGPGSKVVIALASAPPMRRMTRASDRRRLTRESPTRCVSFLNGRSGDDDDPRRTPRRHPCRNRFQNPEKDFRRRGDGVCRPATGGPSLQPRRRREGCKLLSPITRCSNHGRGRT